jgi:hypothetical protein
MFEMLLPTSAGMQTFPDSGPGPQTLTLGNSTLGYFGSIPSSALFTRTQLQDAIGLAGITAVNESPQWVKWVMNDKVFFTPLGVLATDVSWQELYNAGAVYGDSTLGKYPNGPGVNQSAGVSKNGTMFRVRLFQGSLSDPVDPTGANALAGAEWQQYFGAFSLTPPSGYTGPQFKLFSNAALAGTSYCWTKNTWSGGDASSSAVILAAAGVNNSPKTSKGTQAWLPILEVDTSGTLLLPTVNIYSFNKPNVQRGVLTSLSTTGLYLTAIKSSSITATKVKALTSISAAVIP